MDNSKDQICLLQSRVTLAHEESQMTNAHNNSTYSATNIDVSIEQPMQATLKSKNIQSLRRSKDNLAGTIQMVQAPHTTTNYQATLDKQAKSFKPKKAA